MTPVLITLVLAVGVGLLSGRSFFRPVGDAFPVRPGGAGGLLLQFLVPPGIWQQVLLFVSFLLLGAFAVANINVIVAGMRRRRVDRDL